MNFVDKSLELSDYLEDHLPVETMVSAEMYAYGYEFYVLYKGAHFDFTVRSHNKTKIRQYIKQYAKVINSMIEEGVDLV